MAELQAQTPLTGVAWAASTGAAPAGWTTITTTLEGTTASFGKGFGQKSGYVLCITSAVTSEPSLGTVVADVQILSEKTPLPPGYVYIREFLEPRMTVSKKKRVCMKLVPLDSAELVVFDIMLSGKSKVVPCYMKIGSELPSEKSLTRPGSKHASIKREDCIYDTSNLYGISAMDGVPFTLHPKFESSITTGTNAFSIFMDLNIKSLADIEKERCKLSNSYLVINGEGSHLHCH
ncbi:multivesicular body subunit 12A isoform X4 [Carettochelys insculpta]|uniref:multivesicular body subunit 12A isoform X4 n=1 Tax=Carettochelys insculpta TaxID=44489 RepID=UPI003EBDE8E7